jgi:CTP:molybdopterin cytidylyltransferase MocA
MDAKRARRTFTVIEMPHFGAMVVLAKSCVKRGLTCLAARPKNVSVCVISEARQFAKAALKGENRFMARNEFSVVVLAAGKGTRLKSNAAKVLHRAGGRTLVEHVVHACKGAGARKICVVVGHQADEVAAIVTPLGAKTVLQQPQRGTGHALLIARRAIGNARYVLVLPGDAPLVHPETLKLLMRAHVESGAAATLLTAVLSDPTDYGRIVRQGNDPASGRVAAIVEQSQLAENQREINEVNSSIYCFTTAKLWPVMARLRPNNARATRRRLWDATRARNLPKWTARSECARLQR